MSRENLSSPSASLLYQQLKEDLRERIENGTYHVGEQIPSTHQLCVEHRISTITVRRTVAELTAEGLLRTVPGKGTFVAGARGEPVKKGTRLIGVVFPKSASPFFLEIFQGIQEFVGLEGYHLVSDVSGNNSDRESQAIMDLRKKGIEGILLIPTVVNRTFSSNRILEDLLAEQFPMVCIDRMIPDFTVDYVTTNNEAGGYLATEYLLKRRHRRIALVLGMKTNTMQERLAGYKRALADYEISLNPGLVRQGYADEAQDEESGYQTTMELLQFTKRPTAVFAGNDVIALGVYRACHELGVAIPHDLSVIGYDDLFYTASLQPPLTTMGQPTREMGRRAAEFLLRRIKGDRGEFETVVLENTLIERKSCAEPVRRKHLQPACVGAGKESS